MLSFTGTLNLEDMTEIQRYRTERSRLGVRPSITLAGTLIFGVATIITVYYGYSAALWAPSLFLFFTSLVRLPVFQASALKRQLKKYPTIEHTIEISEDKVIVRMPDQTTESSWSAIKDVWRAKHGYVFFTKYDQIWFFLPRRLFSNPETELKLTQYMESAHVRIIDKA